MIFLMYTNYIPCYTLATFLHKMQLSQNFHKQCRPLYIVLEIFNFKLSFNVVSLPTNVPVDGSSYKLPGFSSSNIMMQHAMGKLPTNKVMPLGSMFIPYVKGSSEKLNHYNIRTIFKMQCNQRSLLLRSRLEMNPHLMEYCVCGIFCK